MQPPRRRGAETDAEKAGRWTTEGTERKEGRIRFPFSVSSVPSVVQFFSAASSAPRRLHVEFANQQDVELAPRGRTRLAIPLQWASNTPRREARPGPMQGSAVNRVR